MQITVKGKHLDIGDALRTHVEGALPKVTEKYFDNAVSGDVLFSKEKHLFRADIAANVGKHMHMQAHGEADDVYIAFDLAAGKIAKQLRRYKRRLRDHHKDTVAADHLPAAAYVLQPEPEPADAADAPEAVLEDDPAGGGDEPVVVAEMQTQIYTLSVSEAVMRMDLLHAPALMFRNRAHGGLNMVYRRPDGHIGWVDPHQQGN